MKFPHGFLCKEILFTGRISLSTSGLWPTATIECLLSRPSVGRASQLALRYLGNPGMEWNSGLSGRVGPQNMIWVKPAPLCPAWSESLTEVSEKLSISSDIWLLRRLLNIESQQSSALLTSSQGLFRLPRRSSKRYLENF